MRLFKIFCVTLLLPLLLSFGSSAAWAEQIAIPKLNHRVTDLTQTLTAEQVETLSTKLANLEKTKGSQVAVLIVATTGEETIEQFGIRVVDEWKIGRKGVADGVLLLIAKNDKKMRIEVGRGLEGALPDVVAARIIREFIRPQFKQNDFAAGINIGIDKISSVIEGEPLPPPPAKSSKGHTAEYAIDENIFGLPPFLWLIIFVMGLVLYKKAGPWIGRSGLAAGSSIAAFTAGTPIGIALIIGAGLTLILSIIMSRFFWDIAGTILQNSLMNGYIGGNNSSSSNGSFGSSNDGFFGGGGDFGGGGASGDW